MNKENGGKYEKTFFFCLTVCSRRTGAPIGKRCGVVWANSANEAEQSTRVRFDTIDTTN